MIGTCSRGQLSVLDNGNFSLNGGGNFSLSKREFPVALVTILWLTIEADILDFSGGENGVT